MVVERHDRSFALIGRQFYGDSGNQTVIFAFDTLQLDDERNTTIDQIKHLTKRWHMICGASDLQCGGFGKRQIADVAFATGKALQFIVVKDDNTAVTGEMHIAFDSEPRFDCCLER